MLNEKVGLIGRKNYKINDDLSLYIPSLSEIRGDDGENEICYYELIRPFVITSTNCMVMLYDMGINFEDISDWQLFLMLYSIFLNGRDLYLLFGVHSIANFHMEQTIQDASEDINTFRLVDNDSNIIITRPIFEKISSILCQIHNIEKQHRNFGKNKDTLDFYVSREKKKIERNKNKPPQKSNIDNLMLGLVCNSDCSYDFQSIQNISIYDFNMCVSQILKNQRVRNYNLGIYTGNIDIKKTRISQDELNIFNPN